MQLMLALDDGLHFLVSQRLAASRESRAHKSHVVHAETCKVLFISDRDARGFQHPAIGVQMNVFIVADDPVEVEKDCLNHYPDEIAGAISLSLLGEGRVRP